MCWETLLYMKRFYTELMLASVFVPVGWAYIGWTWRGLRDGLKPLPK